jgi:transcriptional regulator with XRE-family HTH domain
MALERESSIAFADILAFFRNQRNLTQSKLSQNSGISTGYVAMLESGQRKSPSKGVLESLTRALNLSLEERSLFYSLFQNRVVEGNDFVDLISVFPDPRGEYVSFMDSLLYVAEKRLNSETNPNKRELMKNYLKTIKIVNLGYQSELGKL